VTDLLAPAPHVHPATKTADVVFGFSYLTWARARGRGAFMAQDRFAMTLLEHPRVDRLLICNQHRSYAAKLLKDRGRRGDAGFPRDGRRRLVEPLRLRLTDPSRIRAVERDFARYDRAVERAARRMGLERPAVITTHPLLAGFGRFEWAGGVTFYATDDWASHPGYGRWQHAYEVAYERVRREGRRVCAVSQGVLDAVRPTGATTVVPNGLEPEQWRDVPAPPAWLAELPRPLLVYVGTLDSRIDADAVLAAARARPEATVLLVGPVFDRERIGRLAAAPNVVIREPLPHAEVPAVIGAADACLLPHVRTPLTVAMSPLKLYEYLAAGRPVAAIDLPPVHGIDPRVVMAADAGEFAAAVDRALAAGPATEAERLEFVRRNDWRARHERILEFALA
jgi:hypothetical protein